MPSSLTDSRDNPLLLRCEQDLEAGQLVLPTLPDISLQIRRVINDDKANNSKIAKVVQMDPAITGRLIQIANSPLYLGRKKIESCPEALTRLGLKAAQHLITSIALKTVFVGKSPSIRKRMQALWQHSSYVAAISAVLAHKTRGFDPDRAMLAGLVHDIGIVPILTYADCHPELVTDPAQLEATVQQLRAPVGAMVLRQWSFPADFDEMLTEAENWWRSHDGVADYTDLVILSQLHSFIGTLQIHKYPRMSEIPAYSKVLADHAGADMSKDVLGLAREEIVQIQHMLTS